VVLTDERPQSQDRSARASARRVRAGATTATMPGATAGCLVRAAGVESEMELAFAGLHQLLAPVLDRADRLSVPRRYALRTALGLSAGPVPDRFLVGLAALGLLSEVAADRWGRTTARASRTCITTRRSRRYPPLPRACLATRSCGRG
jgi:hypothetical protein